MRSHVPGQVYLLHFTIPYVAIQHPGKKYQCAKHYLGWSEDLIARLTAHQKGNGARLVQVTREAGIGWHLARVWDGDRFLERRLKKRGGRSRLCPICQGTGLALEWEIYDTTAALLNSLSRGAR
jgi:hypothetical protein